MTHTSIRTCTIVLVAVTALAATASAQQQAPGLVPAGQDQVPSVTLDQAIRLAHLAQPSVVRAERDVFNAEKNRLQAVGDWLPSLNFTSSGRNTWNEGVDRVDPNTGLPISGNSTSTTVGFGFNGSWDVFTGFRRGADNRAARASIEAAESGLVDARYQVSLQTKTQFYAALYGTDLVRVRQAGVRRAEEQLEVSVNKLATGTATRSDSLRSAVNLGNARLQLVQAATQLATAEASLGRLIGYEGRVRAVDDSALYQPRGALDTEALRAEALASSPAVMAAEADARAAEQTYKSAKSAWWPNLTLSGSWNWNGNNQVNDYELLSQRSLNLSLSYPLFNGFTRERNIAVQSNNADVAMATAADTRRQVIADLIVREAEYDAALLSADIAEASLTAAEEDLRVINERYRLGASTIIDVLTSQEALTQAEVDLVNARFEVLLARARIEALIGRPL